MTINKIKLYSTTSKAKLAKKALYEKAVLQLVTASVSMEFGVSTHVMLRSFKGDANTCLARQTAIYLVHIIFQLKIIDAAHVFKRDRTTITNACHVIEDRREDPDFDEKLTKLEVFLEGSPIRTPYKNVA